MFIQKRKILIVCSVFFFIFFEKEALSEALQNLPWSKMEYSLFDWGEESIMSLDSAICTSNEIKILHCYQFAFRGQCAELYSVLILPDTFHNVFEEKMVPDIRIDSYNIPSPNPTFKEPGEWESFPAINAGDGIVWLVQLESSNSFRENQTGIFYRLSNGEESTFFMHMSGGITLKTHFPLNGLAPLLAKSLQIAEEKKPGIKSC